MSEALNPEQRAAVRAPDGPVLILAGAGTGKTRTIVHRVAFLIAERGIAPHRILAVTFTNKAAEELKTRLTQMIGDDAGGVISGTFHAVSLRILRRFADALGYPRDFQVLDADDQLTVCRRVLRAKNIPAERVAPQYLRAWIERCKNAALFPEDAPQDALNGVALNELYAAYQAELFALKRMDFSDLILNVIRLLREQPGPAAAIRAMFDHVLVDEYQDTNPAQHLWLVELCREHGNLTVVGDDDQSIYGWRGAKLHHILEFERLFPGARVYRLQTNYRSTQAILSLANAVIAANEARHPKELVAVKGEGTRPVWRECRDDHAEAEAIAAFVTKALADGIPAEEVAVLYRSHRQSLPIEEALRRQGIPYRILGGLGFFERMEVKDALAYWALVNGCADAWQLLRVANKPRRGVGPKTLAALEEALAAFSGTPAAWLDALRASPPAGALKKLVPLAEAVAKVREQASARADRGLWPILEEVDYFAMLAAEGEAEAETRIENLRTLRAFIEEHIAAGARPQEVLDRASLLSREETPEGAQVTVTTLHRAKGLEFTAVAIAGVEEGLLPHQRAIEEGPESIAEERRLFYVGITRAKERLLITSARMRRGFDGFFLSRPSRFLQGLPEGLLERRIERPKAIQPASVPAGARVRHPSFGLGVLLGTEGVGDGLRVTVSFDRHGIKRLMWKYAQLEVLDDETAGGDLA